MFNWPQLATPCMPTQPLFFAHCAHIDASFLQQFRQPSVTASQSSLWRAGFDAGNALDGKVPQARNSVFYCIHTQQTSNPWWQVSSAHCVWFWLSDTLCHVGPPCVARTGSWLFNCWAPILLLCTVNHERRCMLSYLVVRLTVQALLNRVPCKVPCNNSCELCSSLTDSHCQAASPPQIHHVLLSTPRHDSILSPLRLVSILSPLRLQCFNTRSGRPRRVCGDCKRVDCGPHVADKPR